MPSPPENLAGAGQPLHREPADPVEYAGLVRSGIIRLTDAEKPSNSLGSRFDLAYNAAHALSLAALRHAGYPVEQSVHRVSGSPRHTRPRPRSLARPVEMSRSPKSKRVRGRSRHRREARNGSYQIVSSSRCGNRGTVATLLDRGLAATCRSGGDAGIGSTGGGAHDTAARMAGNATRTLRDDDCANVCTARGNMNHETFSSGSRVLTTP